MSSPARPNLMPAAALVSLLVFLLGATGLFSLHHANTRAVADHARLATLNRAHLGAVHARADFKTQIQEWKNILLRGADPADLATYRARFEQQEAAVRTQLEDLARTLPALQLAPAADAPGLLAEHERLGAAYRAALAGFNPAADPAAARRADAAVRGADRRLSDDLDAVADALGRTVATELQTITDTSAARYQTMRRLVLVVAAVTILAALWLAFAVNRGGRA